MEKNLQMISETTLSAAQQTAGAPVNVRSLRIAYEYTHNREILFISGTNQSPRTIRSLYFDLACSDDAGDLLGTAQGACLRNLELAPDGDLPDDAPVVIPFAGTCSVLLMLKKVVFTDGFVWREGDAPVPAECNAAADEPAPLVLPEPASAPESATPEEVAEPVQIPDEWLNPPATVEGYRAAAQGLASLGDAGKPYLIRKFTALADKLEKEAAEAAQKAAEAERAARQESDYRTLLSRKCETAEEWEALAADLAKLSGYKDSARRADEAKKKVKSIRTSEKRLAAKRAEEAKLAAAAAAAKRKRIFKRTGWIAGIALALGAILLLVFTVLIPAGRQDDYEAAETYLKNGEYTAAINAFEALGDYKDSRDRAVAIRKELTGREDGLFYTSERYPCYSIENGVLSYNSTKVYISDTTLKVPDYLDDQKVTSLAANCFQQLESVTTVILPPTVTSIGDGAFADCPRLTSFEAENLVYIGAEAFRGCTALTEFTVPDKVTSIGISAFQGCTALQKITLPAGVRSLADSLFLHCSALTRVQYDSRLHSIGAEAFAYCGALTDLTIPTAVKTIGNNAFMGCTGLTTLSIPDSVTAMGDKAMAGCTGLTEVKIGSGLTTLPARTFENCTALKTVTLPPLTQIGFAAFNGCTSLTDLYYAGGAGAFAAVQILADNAPLQSATLHNAN